MRYLIPLVLCVTLVGCDGAGIGNRRMALLTPEESEVIRKVREVKTGERDIKPTPRALIRPMSIKKEEFGGDDKELESPWKFRWSWDKGIATPGKPSADNPEYDDQGNLIVKPEIVRAYAVPDIHSGLMYDITESQLRAILEVEVAEFQTPVLGKMAMGVVAGEQYLGGHISKQIIPIFEIESGLVYGYDFEEENATIGCELLIIKF